MSSHSVMCSRVWASTSGFCWNRAGSSGPAARFLQSSGSSTHGLIAVLRLSSRGDCGDHDSSFATRRLLMNPFTESTVARPLAESACLRFNGAAIATRRRKRRALLGLTLGVLTGLALPGAAYALDVNTATQEQLRAV